MLDLSVKLVLGFTGVTYIPADLAGAPFDLGEDFRVALRCNALIKRESMRALVGTPVSKYAKYHQLTSLCL